MLLIELTSIVVDAALSLNAAIASVQADDLFTVPAVEYAPVALTIHFYVITRSSIR